MCFLSPYKKEDASKILSWINDEKVFKMWSTDEFSHFPISSEELNSTYSKATKNLFPFAFYDGDELVGHMTVRLKKDRIVRFAHVIVDTSKRGKGYGSKMLSAALSFAFNEINAREVTIGVYEENSGAFACYTKSGFTPMSEENDVYYTFFQEKWRFIQLKMTAEDYLILNEK